MASEQADFVPALSVEALTPLYQTVVDLFCRDSHVKSLLAARVQADRANDPKKILDLACGPGKLVALLAAQQPCCEFTAMDIDPRMVAEAQHTTSALPNVRVVNGDATAPSFGDDSFDVVVESLMFHHLTDAQKRAAIAAVARILRDDGLFYFVDWVKPATVYSQLAFKIVRLLDGAENTRAHADNAVLAMVREQLPRLVGVPTLIETSVGTLGIYCFAHALPVLVTGTDSAAAAAAAQ